jgi:molybdate transport system regulatory protein
MSEGLRPVVKVLLAKSGAGEKDAFCGPGMVRLLQAINETGNVRGACEAMGLSYSKGWKMLKALETCLGISATVRQQGGKGGGEASLTPQGAAFLEKYLVFEADCKQAVRTVFKRYFVEMRNKE